MKFEGTEDQKHKAGIYEIVNLVTGQKYVGSTVGFHWRYRCHFADLKANRHANPKLQHSFNKYKEKSFSFLIKEVVTEQEECLIKTIRTKEQLLIDGWDYYFNIRTEVTCTESALTRRVLQYSIDGIFLKEYHSVAAASRDNSLGMEQIRKVINGSSNIHGGYRWVDWTENYSKNIGPLVDINSKQGMVNFWQRNRYSINQFSKKTGKLIRVWDSRDLMLKELGLNKRTFNMHISSNRPASIKGFTFEVPELKGRVVKMKKSVSVTNSTETKVFPSISEASKHIGVNPAIVSRALKLGKQVRGYDLQFVEP